MMENGDLFDFVPEKRKSRADQIFRRFRLFHESNPIFWELFQAYAFDVIKAGFKHYSVDAIFERIRWHVNIETRNDDGLKLNNDFRAYYARLFEVVHEDHAGFFRKRKRTSAERPAFKHDIAFCYPGELTNEIELYEKLRQLV